jgi:predicted PhzF superfamily epimerase YddE/YHI9
MAKKTARRASASARPAAKRAAKPVTRPAARKPARTKPARPRATGEAYPLFVVNAFTARAFHGNPAAVVLCEGRFPADDLMQSMATQHNLSETAFITVGKGPMQVRWFSPCVEVDLCGHATLAAAHVLWTEMGVKAPEVVFKSPRSGKLGVRRVPGLGKDVPDLYELDLPARPGQPVKVTTQMSAAIGRMPAEAYLADDLVLVLENRRDVYECRPDFGAMMGLDGRGVVITAPGSGHDLVCRAFYPKLGINEDPVTGSAHCTLVPYWSSVLGKAQLRSHQVSWRGGELWCTLRGDRVAVAGHAVTYSSGRAVV